jgi:hypothetical protein
LQNDDDNYSSSGDDSSQTSKSSGTSGNRPGRQDSSFQEPECSKEWMFHGVVALRYTMDWDHSDAAENRSELGQRLKASFPEIGKSIKESFSQHAPASIEHIMIVSNIEKVSAEHCERSRKVKMLAVPVRGYVATATRVHRKAWEDSIPLCDTDRAPLTWTKITGGIRCCPQFNHDRDDVNDPQSTVDVLTMWGTRSYFNAVGSTWRFDGSLQLPPRTAENSDIMQMAREAFNAAAGPRNAWPRSIAFLAVHCEIAKLMSADAAHAVRIPVRGFLQAGQSRSYKWETWLPSPWDWRPLRGGLGGNEEFESASIEVRSESSEWLEIIVDGKLGKNNAGRLADAKQARAAHSSSCSSDPCRVRALTRIAIFSTGSRRKRLVVLEIQILLSLGHQCGRERRRRQAPPNRTGGLGFSYLCKCCIGAAAAEAAARRGQIRTFIPRRRPASARSDLGQKRSSLPLPGIVCMRSESLRLTLALQSPSYPLPPSPITRAYSL